MLPRAPVRRVASAMAAMLLHFGDMLIALTREISPAIARCELTHLPRAPIDLARARAQHSEYEQRLAEAGCRVVRLATDRELPDCVFIEDAAVVLREVAIVTRLGAVSRRGETAAVAGALRSYRPLAQIEAPGTLDGGDILVAGRQVFAGVSGRTNSEGVRQLRAIVAPYGFVVQEIEVRGCLHLKSAVTLVGENLLLMNPARLPSGPFAAFDRIEVDPREPLSANGVLAGGQVIFAGAFPHTFERLQARGLRVLTVQADELAKAEGALTCCSLIFDAPSATELTRTET
jgi:dimethylargininase